MKTGFTKLVICGFHSAPTWHKCDAILPVVERVSFIEMFLHNRKWGAGSLRILFHRTQYAFIQYFEMVIIKCDLAEIIIIRDYYHIYN